MTYRVVLLSFVATAAMFCGSAVAQPVSIGSLGPPDGSFGPGLITVIDSSFPASGDGMVTSATFQWSAAPCPAAVKIKIFRFVPLILYGMGWFLEGERGPFDVQQFTQAVALTPPLEVRKGDLIAITSLSLCGEPVQAPASGYSVVVQGDAPSFSCDVRFGACPPSKEVGSHPLVRATDDILPLLKNRFFITLSATDPRTGRSTIGHGVSQGDRWGFFALPEFTGDPNFPEVIVKMADATLAPPPFGGSFWFFYSSLTDVQYTMTVTDQVTGRTRTYSNSQFLPGQLCGGADTNAFPP